MRRAPGHVWHPSQNGGQIHRVRSMGACGEGPGFSARRLRDSGGRGDGVAAEASGEGV